MIIPPFETEGQTCPMGFPMSQNRYSPMIWSYVFEKYPPARIIELGSMNGGFTIALAFMTWTRRVPVFSYDRQQAPDERYQGLANFLGVRFIQDDIFNRTTEIAGLARKPGRTYLLCDGGNKLKEFQTFASWIKTGDVIAAHDTAVRPEFWPWKEISPEDLTDTILEQHLSYFFHKELACAGWLSFQKE